MQRVNYILRRILQMIPVLFVVSLAAFFVIRLVPGDPARLMLGEKATNEAVAAIRLKLGLDEPLYIQYMKFMQGVFHLDFGNSLKFQRPVIELIVQRLPVTLMLTVMSTLFAVIISVPVGYFSGMHKAGVFDRITNVFTLVIIALPTFWVGLMLLIFFGIYLKILPVGGLGEGVAGYLKSFILPAFTQSLMTSALLIRNVRNSVVDIITQDYVDFARSKGVGERDIKYRHILKNAMISTVTLLSMRMAYMLGGSVIIESVFALPGLGKLTIDSIYARDYTVVQAVVLIFAVVVMVINLLTDVLYSILDPRVSY
ncbi:MAG: ABC transporter permease [Clostridium sp.]|nr:ABC transporter permease [Clostridium sp.]